MSWEDRLREAAYTSPSGARITFVYENVSQEVDKKTTGFSFPDANGTYVQDLGHSGRRYPLRVFFSGEDYDQAVIFFEEALIERGTGRLEHPMYGVIDVVPFGSITRRDDLKTAANQAVIEVTFWETINLIYPASQTDPASSVLSAVKEYNTAAAESFNNVLNLDTAVERVSLRDTYRSTLSKASNGLKAIASTQENVRQQFNAIIDSVNQGLDVLIADPITLAFQTTQLIQAPARARSAIKDRLDAYRDLADAIMLGNGANVGNDSRAKNAFHSNDLYVSSYVTGSVVSVVNNQFVTKTDALQAAEDVLDQLDNVVAWRDLNFAELNQVDTGEAYQKLQKAVALTAGFLVEISFTLKQERRIVLSRSRTIIDLCAELYGSVDDQLDFLISSNELTGSEILELPRGKEIAYFV